MIRIGFYLAIGALLHWAFVGAHFDFTSALTWLWLFGWPLMLIVTFGIIATLFLLFVLFCLGVAKLISPLA